MACVVAKRKIELGPEEIREIGAVVPIPVAVPRRLFATILRRIRRSCPVPL